VLRRQVWCVRCRQQAGVAVGRDEEKGKVIIQMKKKKKKNVEGNPNVQVWQVLRKVVKVGIGMYKVQVCVWR